MSSSYLDRRVSEDLAGEAEKETSLRQDPVGQGQLTRALVERLQFVKLCRTLRYVAEKSAFYRELYADHGFDPTSVRSLADLQRIPFTEPAHIVKESYRFACVPMGDVARIVTLTSSGTSGVKKRVLFTESDLRRIGDMLASDTKVVIGEKRAIVQIMLPGSTAFGQAHLLGKAIESAGSVPLVTGILPDVTSQIKSIARNGCTALVGYPSYLRRLTKLGSLGWDLGQMGIEAIVTAGEPLPASVKADLERSWNAKVFSHYGLTEMGFNAGMGCGQGSGYHIHEADYIVEVVDPATGQPLEEGQEGELVITSIHREGMPIVRYKTGDLASMLTEPCACGSSLKQIGRVTRHTGAIIKIGTTEVCTSHFDERLFSVPEIVDYRVVVTNGSSMFRLCFLIETAGEATITPSAVLNILEEELSAKGICSRPGRTVEVRFVPSLEPAQKRCAVASI
jgi:phenylacetate-CoA ligase